MLPIPRCLSDQFQRRSVFQSLLYLIIVATSFLQFSLRLPKNETTKNPTCILSFLVNLSFLYHFWNIFFGLKGELLVIKVSILLLCWSLRDAGSSTTILYVYLVLKVQFKIWTLINSFPSVCYKLLEKCFILIKFLWCLFVIWLVQGVHTVKILTYMYFVISKIERIYYYLMLNNM